MSKSYTKTTKDIYKLYAAKLIADNPGWWGKYEQKITNYRIYKKVGPQIVEVMNFKRFKAVITAWFRGAQTYIINGKALVLGHKLGRIAGRLVERNHNNKQVNWQASEAMWKEKGERKGIIYFVDDNWVRIGWEKTGKIHNDQFYKFDPAEGNVKQRSGFKQKFSQANKADRTLRLRYKYYPYIIND